MNSDTLAARPPVFASALTPRAIGAGASLAPHLRASAAAGSDGRSPQEMLSALMASHDAFKADQRGQMKDVRAAIDDIQTAFDDTQKKLAAALVRPGEQVEGSAEIASDPEYSRLFASWARQGVNASQLLEANQSGERQRINNAMTGSPGEAGGYLAPIEWDRRISKAQRALSPFRQLATVISTSVRAYSTVWSLGGWGTGWVGETANRPATNTADLRTLTFAHGEIYAFPMISQQLVDDADFNIEEWLATEVAEEFDRQEGVAFLSGDGVNKPRGLLTYVTGGASASEHPGGVLATTPSGNASAITPDSLITLVYALASPYRQNARWLMNSLTAAAVSKLKDAGGNFMWREGMIVGQPATLLGYPIAIDEGMPDVAAGSTPIAFGDFARGYVINDRVGVRVLRDPYTAKPFVGYYTTKRVGGGVLDPNAIRLLKVAAS